MGDIFKNLTGVSAERAFTFSDDPELLDPAKKTEWLKFRRSGIGASDIGAIAGLNPWRSPIDVFLDKTQGEANRENEKMKWGKILEEPVAQEFAEREKVKVQRVNAILRDQKTPFFLTSLDRIILKNGHADPIFDMGTGALEVKTTSWGHSWEGGAIPPLYDIQLQWELMVAGLKWGRLACLIGGQDLVITPVIKYDPEVCQKLAFLGNKFWTENVLANRIPEPTTPADLESVKKMWDRDEGTTYTFPENFEAVLSSRQACKMQIDALDDKRKIFDAQILHQMGNNKYGVGKGYKVTRVIKADLRLDSKKVKELYPQIYAECSYSGSTIYPLVKEIK